MDKERTCFFTGHRIIAAKEEEKIREKVREKIENYILKYGVDTFISGGALGFDMIGAEEVIKMREKYEQIKLKMYLPCYDQSKKWDEINKYRYRMIISAADEYIYTTKKNYTDECMKYRNIKMIWDSRYCIAFCRMVRSGTNSTLQNAYRADIIISNIANEI